MNPAEAAFLGVLFLCVAASVLADPRAWVAAATRPWAVGGEE